MAKLKVLVGPTGSGKSTWAQVWRGADEAGRRIAGNFDQAVKFLEEGFDVALDSEDMTRIVSAADPEEHGVEILQFA